MRTIENGDKRIPDTTHISCGNATLDVNHDTGEEVLKVDGKVVEQK